MWAGSLFSLWYIWPKRMLTPGIVSVPHFKGGYFKKVFKKKYLTVNHCEYRYLELLKYGSLGIYLEVNLLLECKIHTGKYIHFKYRLIFFFTKMMTFLWNLHPDEEANHYLHPEDSFFFSSKYYLSGTTTVPIFFFLLDVSGIMQQDHFISESLHPSISVKPIHDVALVIFLFSSLCSNLLCQYATIHSCIYCYRCFIIAFGSYYK